MVGFVAFCFVILSVGIVGYSVHKLRKREQAMMLERGSNGSSTPLLDPNANLINENLANANQALSNHSAIGKFGKNYSQASEQKQAVQLVHEALNMILSDIVYVTAKSARESSSQILSFPTLPTTQNTPSTQPSQAAQLMSSSSPTPVRCPKCGADWNGAFSFCLHCSYTAA